MGEDVEILERGPAIYWHVELVYVDCATVYRWMAGRGPVERGQADRGASELSEAHGREGRRG